MTWEYAVLDSDECDLEALGKAGWELVAVVPERWENERKGYTENFRSLYFKRPGRPTVAARSASPVQEQTPASRDAMPGFDGEGDPIIYEGLQHPAARPADRGSDA